MDLIHMWHDDRYWSRILCGTISIQVHDLKVKVTDLEFLCKCFALQFLKCQFLQSSLYMFGMMIDDSFCKAVHSCLA